MISNTTNPKPIYVSSTYSGCCTLEFDSNYQNDLNGVINEDEFRESINKINRRISPKKFIIMFVLVFILGIIGAIVCFVVALSMSTGSSGSVFIGVAVALFLFGAIFTFVGGFILSRRSVKRIQKAIIKESEKYSSRSPISCNWRLQTTNEYVEDAGYRPNHLLIIDIHRSTPSVENRMHFTEQIINESSSTFRHHDDTAPPSYSSVSIRFCPQCGTSRQNHSDNFCTSCGHSFTNIKISI